MTATQKQGFLVLTVAFLVRFVAAGVTTVTTLNPDSTADARGFASAANTIADGLLRGQLVTSGGGYIYDLWGTFLAPFWLLPGPSGFYARLGNALLGAIAIYNVYLIVRVYHSHQAGVIASLPMIFYPSFVAVHSTLLREAMVLFGITTAVRFLVLPPKRLPRCLAYVVAGVMLYVAYILRTDNAIIYGVAFGAALVVYGLEYADISAKSLVAAAAFSAISFVLAIPLVRDGIDHLARIRELRSFGRTVYLSEVIPQTIPEFLAFSWIGAAYFFYAPFPWMIETVPDLLVGTEGMITLGFTVTAVWGVRWLGQKDTPVTVGLLAGLAVAAVLYGAGTVNFGTGMRHRQMFLWIVFLFGAIGISEYMKFEFSFD